MKMRRLNLELSQEAYEKLEALRKRMGKPSKAEVLRSAVGLLELVRLQKARGKSLVLLNDEVDARIEII